MEIFLQSSNSSSSSSSLSSSSTSTSSSNYFNFKPNHSFLLEIQNFIQQNNKNSSLNSIEIEFQSENEAKIFIDNKEFNIRTIQDNVNNIVSIMIYIFLILY